MSTVDLLISLGTAALVAVTSYFNARGRDHINKSNDWTAAVAADILKHSQTSQSRDEAQDK